MKDPLKNSKSSYRFIKKIMEMSFAGKVIYVKREFDLISHVFCKAGGSWERIFDGVPSDINLLKKTVRIAYKKGYLTKSSKWV